MKRYARNTAWAIGAGAALALFGAGRARVRRNRLANKVVLITGGSRGFGLALAHEFAKLQCRIALCARDQDELERAGQTLERAGHRVFTIPCDISDHDKAWAMVEAVRFHYGSIDILVNNAGEIMVSPLKIWKSQISNVRWT